MQIIVLGMHRSGTSAVTRLVNMMGAYAGSPDELIGHNDENPKGFWERRDVIEANDALLTHFGCEWYDLADWPHRGDETNLALPDHFSANISAIIAQLNTHACWVMKDPRLCHTFPYWRPLLDDPCFILVHRDPLEIAHSLATRNEFTYSHALSLWEYAATGMCNIASGTPRTLAISYPDVIERPVESCRLIHDRLVQWGADTLSMPENSLIEHFIEPSLYRSKGGTPAERSMAFTGYQQSLCDALAHSTLPESLPLSVSRHAQEIMRQSTRAQTMQLQKATAEEALGRALQTISEHEARQEELVRDCKDARHAADILAAENTALKQLNAELSATKAECDAIKATRWWQLRERVLKVLQ